MHPTSSPWLAQLHAREPYILKGSGDADVAIIGAGISGISTAFHILTQTNSSVLLVDAGLIARGATGRNAGHVVSEFERPVPEIVKDFGREQTIDAVACVDSGWDILEKMLNITGIGRDTYETCTGYNGFITVERLIEELETHAIRLEAGIKHDPLLVVADPKIVQQIPEHLQGYVIQIPRSEILELLETDDDRFIGLETTHIGCMNSAFFCEQVVLWMMKKYPDRFTVAENMPIVHITLEKDKATLKTADRTINTHRVVLCTNGFTPIPIHDTTGDHDHDIQTSVNGVVGYMTGYLTDEPLPVSAITYYDPDEFYLTRRHFKVGTEKTRTFISAGGCERPLTDGETFDANAEFPKDIEERLHHEIKETYRSLPATSEHSFLWQGLQGYIPSGIRRIGYEPLNHVLMYNTACNGIGILPAIYGGHRIAQLLSGVKLPPSIFDPVMGGK